MKIVLLFFTLFAASSVNAQHIAVSFQNAAKQNISTQKLDDSYMSAIDTDTTKSVFIGDSAQEAMYNAYVKLLKDLGKFLRENNFNWEKVTKGFNRIYFNKDGAIEYFIYNFHLPSMKPEYVILPEKESEYNRLLNIFIQDYKIEMTADKKFAQCSPVTFNPSVIK
jgi:hypothetical protein